MRASETYQEWGKNYEKNQNTVIQKRCGYVASNRSRFSKHQMTRSPVFSVHFTNRKNPAKPDYHMSIKKSQAILKCFIDLKNSVWLTMGSEDERENIGTAGHLMFSTP